MTEKMEDILLQRKIILTDEQYNTLKKDGSIEVNGIVLYDEDINEYQTIDKTDEKLAQIRQDYMTDLSELESNLETNYANTQIDNTFVGQNTFDKTILLPNSPTTPETFTLTNTYTSRVTANGEQTVVDGSSTHIEKIQGSTIASTNLIPFPYETESAVKNGLTFTVNNDGTILVNGTATAQTEFTLVQNVENFLTDGQTYYFKDIKGADEGLSNAESYFTKLTYVQSGVSTQVVDGMFTYDKPTFSPNIFINIRIANGFTVNNLLFHPMLNKGDTALPYSPYFSGLKHTNFSGIKSTGRNLIPLYKIESRTHRGITFTQNDDGAIVINGQNDGTGNSRLVITENFSLKKGTYITNVHGNIYLVIVDTKGNVVTDWASTSSNVRPRTLEKNYDKLAVWLQVRDGDTTVYDNYVVYPTINLGETAQPYEPHTENTYQLPETIELSKYDYLDIQEKELVRGSYTIRLDGSEPWYLFSNGVTVGIALSDIGAPRAAYFKGVVATGDFTNLFQFTSGTATNGLGAIQAKGSSELDSVEAVKAYLEANPVYVCYEVQTPTVEKLINIPQSYTVYDNGTEYLYDENSIYGTQTTVTQTYSIIENPTEAANKAYVQNGLAQKLDKTGGTITGHLIVENGTDTTLSALVVKNNDATYGLALDNDDTYKLGKGSLDDKGKFEFSEGEGHPITLRDDSSLIKDNALLRWDATTNKLVDSGMSPDRIQAELNGEVTILTVEGSSVLFNPINTGFSSNTVVDFGDGTVKDATELTDFYTHEYKDSGKHYIKIYNTDLGGILPSYTDIKISKTAKYLGMTIDGAVEKIEIPASVTNIAISAYSSCSNLSTVVMKGTTPPILGTGAFENCPLTKIIVPYEALDTYRSAEGWSDYATIIDSYALVSTLESRLSDILNEAKAYTDENTPVIERLG